MVHTDAQAGGSDTGLDAEEADDISGRITRDYYYSVENGPRAGLFVGYYRGSDNSSMKVALKLVKSGFSKPETNHYHKLRQEIQTWRKFNHPNVLPFLGISSELERDGFPALVSPFCSNGIVTSYLVHYPLSSRIFMILKIIEGLVYLHGMNVIHGDLKPNNILIDDQGNPVLCDFGCSRVMRPLVYDPYSMTSGTSSMRYTACELLKSDDNDMIVIEAARSPASDVYSFAMVSYQIWSGSPPYSDELFTNASLQWRILSSRQKLPIYPCPEPIGTEKVWPILNKCWETDPRLRPTSMEVRRLLHTIWPASSPRTLYVVSPSDAPTSLKNQTTTTLDNDLKVAEQGDRIIPPSIPSHRHPVLIPKLETNLNVQEVETVDLHSKVTMTQDEPRRNVAPTSSQTSLPNVHPALTVPPEVATPEQQSPPSSPRSKSFKKLFIFKSRK